MTDSSPRSPPGATTERTDVARAHGARRTRAGSSKSGPRRSPSHTAFAALPAIALDLEREGRGAALARWCVLALVSRLAVLLDEAGVRRCLGGIMASNREWRGIVPPWRERVDGWLRLARSEPRSLVRDLRSLDDTLEVLRSSIAR